MKKQLNKMGLNERVVTMSAVRYMCGKGSYGVGCVIDHVIDNKDRLMDKNKAVIERDILEKIEEYPDMPYKQEWLDLIDYISKTN